MKTSAEYRAKALSVLSGKWSAPVIFTLVFMATTQVASLLAVPMRSENLAALLSLIIMVAVLPIGWAYAVSFLRNLHEPQEFAIASLFDIYQKDWKRILTTLLLEVAYIILWSMLLIIPGIIKSYSYAMTNFILEEDPEIEGNEAIEKSMAMMEGHKMELFLLDMSFCGWMLLSILTCGIGLLWLSPYMQTARAAFYEDLKAEAAAA